MRNERVSRHFSLVEPFSALGYSFLKFQASMFFSLSHFGNRHRFSAGHGFVHQAVLQFQTQTLFRLSGPFGWCSCSSGPTLLLADQCKFSFF